jgi:hypothetical protein
MKTVAKPAQVSGPRPDCLRSVSQARAINFAVPSFPRIKFSARSLWGEVVLAACLIGCRAGAFGQTIGNHRATYDGQGLLLPWTTWRDALAREVNWYLLCPVEQGYPRFAFTTFMDGKYLPMDKRPSFIPATQDGMGIISYLKYYAFTGKKDARVLQVARSFGDYLVAEASTPNEGKYPRFTRSTGWRARFPQPPDCGSQDDQPYEIEPDKGGLAGFALVLLYDATQEEKYLQQALANARALATNQIEGSATRSPWPARADYRTGAARGEVSGNMSFNLMLFDTLIERGHPEFQGARDKLWSWIKDFQIPNATKDGLLWVHFFEDHSEPDDRTAWAPLNLARYLLEKKAALDPDWARDANTLIDFVNHRFVHVYDAVAVCGEQDHDQKPWGGISTTYGAVLALYAQATSSPQYKTLARLTLNWALYATNDDGCPSDAAWKSASRGGWQEDAHTDKLHNYMDAIAAFPEWGE